jgi:hypothetical protein
MGTLPSIFAAGQTPLTIERRMVANRMNVSMIDL